MLGAVSHVWLKLVDGSGGAYGLNLGCLLDILILLLSDTVLCSLVGSLAVAGLSFPRLMVILMAQRDSLVTWKFTNLSLSERAILR